MEKRGVIEDGRTPPENNEKQAEAVLEEHLSRRAAEAARQQLQKEQPSEQ